MRLILDTAGIITVPLIWQITMLLRINTISNSKRNETRSKQPGISICTTKIYTVPQKEHKSNHSLIRVWQEQSYSRTALEMKLTGFGRTLSLTLPEKNVNKKIACTAAKVLQETIAQFAIR